MATAVRADNMPTVWVVQEDPKKNLIQAMDFGNVEAILGFDDELSFLNVQRIAQKIRWNMRRMMPGDYILPVGNPISIGLTFIVAQDLTAGDFKVLRWDSQERRYYSVDMLAAQKQFGQ